MYYVFMPVKQQAFVKDVMGMYVFPLVAGLLHVGQKLKSNTTELFLNINVKSC
jgi:hypothetical protein